MLETPPPEAAPERAPDPRVLVLGVGNLLMGDEGVGVHVVRHLESGEPLPGVRLLDGGTGGIHLLRELDDFEHVVLVDATIDGSPAGQVARLEPRGVGDLPRGLGAHDFGLKDLFAVAALSGRLPRIHLFTISVQNPRPMCLELSPEVAAAIPVVAAGIRRLAATLAPC